MWAPGQASADNPTVTVQVLDSHGNGLPGVQIRAGNGNAGWYALGTGTTDASGKVSGVLPAFGGPVEYKASYNQGSAVSPEITDLSQTYVFHTVEVTLLNGPPLIYATNGNSGWHSYPGPMEMFPGSYLINNGHGNVALTVGSSNFTGGIVRLIDHTGNGLAGGTADYYLGGWQGLPGSTDANGNLLFSIPNDSPNLSMAMHYGGKQNQQDRTQLGNSNFTFQTALVNVRLKDADGNPLDTGSASYYATAWHTIGDTSGGVVSQELLPGSYSFAMVYNHTRQQLDGVVISAPTTDVVFQTGRLTAYFSQPFYWVNSQFYSFASGDSQEFLPGLIGLQLPVNGCQTAKFPIAAGDHLVKTGIVATLANSSNQPLAGGVASAYAGGWKPIGTTGSNGKTCAALDGKLGNTAVAMVYNGTRQQISQNAQTNSIYPFKTTDVSVELRDSGGSLMDTGGASYYAGSSWHSIGNTSGGVAHVQMLPGSYSFAMTYNGTRQQLNGQAISGTTDTVTFQTTDVTVELHDSGGALLDTGSGSYYAGSSWHLIGDTSGGQIAVQMLPGSYSFAMTYLGTRQQLNSQAISGTSDTVTFQTGKVHSSSGTATSYYASSWKPFTQDMELLPGAYWFDFSDTQPNTQYTLVGGTTNNIH